MSSSLVSRNFTIQSGAWKLAELFKTCKLKMGNLSLCQMADLCQLVDQHSSCHTCACMQDYLALAEKVVGALGPNLANLYKAGLRNFLIGTLPPSGCLPLNNGQHATRCDEGPASLVDYHNARLSAVITLLRTSLPDARILLLDLFKGFNNVIDNPHWFGK